MSKERMLFDFLYQLIDVQIEKYVRLATNGEGPDNRLDANLVFDEVNELLGLADTLLEKIEHPSPSVKNAAELYSICSQIKYYLEQEKIRADASWLMDADYIDSPNRARVTAQLAELQKIIRIDGPSRPQTATQKQCEYDSHLIAFHILNSAKMVTANPDVEFDKDIPHYVQTILKRNATTRYCQKDICQSINQLHQKCERFFQTSKLTSSFSKLDANEAKQFEQEHRIACNQLLERYRLMHPESVLFCPVDERHNRNVDIATATKAPSSYGKWGLFGTAIGLASTIAASLLINYIFNNHIELESECPWTP